MDVLVAGEAVDGLCLHARPRPRVSAQAIPTPSSPATLLDMLDNMNGSSAEERLARIRARLEREV